MDNVRPVSPVKVPIASLTSGNGGDPSLCIEGEVALVWPYTSSTHDAAILLVEPDARLRRHKGQIRVLFAGVAARAFGKSRIGIGDTVKLNLRGSIWQDPSSPIKTPGKSVGGELVYHGKLSLTVITSKGERATLQLDESQSTHTNDTPMTPVRPSSMIRDAIADQYETLATWTSPIVRFIPSSISTPKARAEYEELAPDDGTVRGKRRKRFRYDRSSGGQWKLVGALTEDTTRSPSPFTEVDGPSTMSSAESAMQQNDEHQVLSQVSDPVTVPLRNAESLPTNMASSPTTMGPPPLAPLETSVASSLSPASFPADPSTPRNLEAPKSPRLDPIKSPGLPLISPFPMSPNDRRRSNYFPAFQSVEPLTDDRNSGWYPAGQITSQTSIAKSSDGLTDFNENVLSRSIGGSRTSPRLETFSRHQDPAPVLDSNATEQDSGETSRIGAQTEISFPPIELENSQSTSFDASTGEAAMFHEFITSSSPGLTDLMPAPRDSDLPPSKISADNFPSVMESLDRDRPDSLKAGKPTVELHDSDVDSVELLQNREASLLANGRSLHEAVGQADVSLNETSLVGSDRKDYLDINLEAYGSVTAKHASLEEDFIDNSAFGKSDQNDLVTTIGPPKKGEPQVEKIDQNVSVDVKSAYESHMSSTSVPPSLEVSALEGEELSDNQASNTSQAQTTENSKVQATVDEIRVSTDHVTRDNGASHLIKPVLGTESASLALGSDSDPRQVTAGVAASTDMMGVFQQIDDLRHPVDKILDASAMFDTPQLANIDSEAKMPEESGITISTDRPTNLMKKESTRRQNEVHPALQTWFQSPHAKPRARRVTRQSAKELDSNSPAATKHATASRTLTDPLSDSRYQKDHKLKNIETMEGTPLHLRHAEQQLGNDKLWEMKSLDIQLGHFNRLKTEDGKEDSATEEPDALEEEMLYNAESSGTFSQNTQGSFRTAKSYYTSLNAIDSYLNSFSSFESQIDVLAVITSPTSKPERSKNGPRDYHTNFYIADPTALSVQVQCFRPRLQALPQADSGDVVLLRNFVVKSQKRRTFLLSGESSSWCVWRMTSFLKLKTNEGGSRDASTLTQDSMSLAEEVLGPPIEVGPEEVGQAILLRKWWEQSISI